MKELMNKLNDKLDDLNDLEAESKRTMFRVVNLESFQLDTK